MHFNVNMLNANVVAGHRRRVILPCREALICLLLQALACQSKNGFFMIGSGTCSSSVVRAVHLSMKVMSVPRFSKKFQINHPWPYDGAAQVVSGVNPHWSAG